MSDYIVSARKYRPDSFSSLIGQDNIARTLKNSIKRNQLAHAYLFCGPRGVGKTSTARIFAKAINCSNPGEEMDPCGQCESCQSFAEGRSYCIHELDAASNNGVEDIKALMDKVQIPPQVGRYSVYIIDEVHMLSGAAFNAFLKTLEEPPAHAVFILCTTEKHKILPTILSRCQTYDFNRISIPDIVRNLRAIASDEKVNIDDESLHVIAHKADGAMRDALTIFDQTVAFCGTDVKYEDVIRNLNVLDYEYSFKLVDAFLQGDYASALLTLDDILARGFNALHFVSAISSHLRDLLVSRTGGLESLLDLPDSLRARYAEQAARCSVKFHFDALGVTSQCEGGFKSAVNQRLHIEYALMRLSFLNAAPAAASAAAAAPTKPAEAPKAPEAPKPVETAKPAEAPKPVEAPKPTDGPKPVEAPKAAGAPKLSLSSLKKSLENSEDEIVPAFGGDEELPAEELICEAWKRLVARISDLRLSTALSNAKLRVESGEGYRELVFSVLNESQKLWLENKMLSTLETNLREDLKSHAVRLSVDVLPLEEGPKVAYMPQEKAKELIQTNPEVKELVANFGLDVK